MSAPKVLLLEDNQSLRQTIAKLMTKRGFDVRVTSSGVEAVAAAASESFDLIITDIRMEGMDGLEALEQVKQAQPDIASLVITGYSTEEDSIRAIRLGAGDYLKKPFKLPVLMESVGQVLGKRAKGRTGNDPLPGTLFAMIEALLTRAGPREASLTAQQLSLRLGLSEEQALWVRAAVLARVLVDSGKLSTTSAGLPDRLRSLLETVTEPWESVPLEARIVAAVLELHPDATDYDPDVLAALATAPAGEDRRTPARRLNGLLSIATALQEKGQVEGSRAALKAVLEQGKNSRQEIESALRLSLLEREQGAEEAATGHVRHALEAAARLGPRLEGQIHLRAGVLWSPHRPDLGQPWLERATELAGKVNDPLLAATAQLGLARFGFSNGNFWPHLKPLAHPQGAPERAEAVPWLLPGLLASQEAEVGKVLEAWAVDYLDVFTQAIASGTLDSPRLLRAIELIAQNGSTQAATALEPLQSHPDQAVRQAATQAVAGLAQDGKRTATLRMLCFGDFQVYRGVALSAGWKTQKVRYLLAYLVGCGNARVPDDTLIDKFWPDSEPAKGRKSLNTAISFLRTHLKESLGVEDLVLRDASGTTINTEIPLWHDVEEFSKLAKRAAEMAKKGQPEVEAVLRRMLDLYRGPYLDGCYMSWALERRHQMERYARETAGRLTELYARRNQPEEVVEIGLRALELEPCQEPVAIRILKAYGKMGRRDEAMRFYRDFCQSLQAELELEPSAELSEAAAAVGEGE